MLPIIKKYLILHQNAKIGCVSVIQKKSFDRICFFDTKIVILQQKRSIKQAAESAVDKGVKN